MTRNRILIVSDMKIKKLSFYFMNEQKKWCPVSNASELSRKRFVISSIKESAQDILDVIKTVYNTGNRGVDLYFEGAEDDFSILQETIRKDNSLSNIECHLQRTTIAVAGKVQSGKTTLITEMEHYQGNQWLCSGLEGVEIYTSQESPTVWYELPGIDIGIEYIQAARTQFERLAKDGVNVFIYCLNTSKIEPLEEELIRFVLEVYPSIKVVLALTQYVDEESVAFPAPLNELTSKTKVIPLLAKELKTREGIIEAYGLNELNDFLFRGQ